MKRVILLACLLLLVACGPSGATATSAPAAPTTGAAVSATATPPATARAAGTPTTAGATRATTAAGVARGAPTRTPGTPGAAARATRTATPIRGANSTPGAANIAPDAGARLIEQAIGLLLERYVDPLNTADLYGAAYDAAVATLHASGKTPQAQRPAFTGDVEGDKALFRQAYLTLAEPVRAEIDQATLAYEAIKGTVRQVNECHTAFLTPEQAQRQRNALQGTDSITGIGVTIRSNTQPLVIGEVYPDTPAQRSGLKTGDAILAVNGLDVTNLTADQVAPLVRGPEGTPVTLTIRRPGEPTPRDVTITRAKINIPTFISRVIDGPDGTKVGYMHLYQFAQGTENEVQKALDNFERQGVTGWVLDLRGNPGGYVNTFAQISSRFLEGRQTVGYQVSRDGKEEPILTNGRSYVAAQRPFAVLINGGSASASEAFAAAAQDYGFARLFGQTTAGCLAVAVYHPLDDGSALEVTVEKFLSPKKREINRVGVEPDEAIAATQPGDVDPTLDAAVRWLATRR